MTRVAVTVFYNFPVLNIMKDIQVFKKRRKVQKVGYLNIQYTSNVNCALFVQGFPYRCSKVACNSNSDNSNSLVIVTETFPDNW